MRAYLKSKILYWEVERAFSTIGAETSLLREIPFLCYFQIPSGANLLMFLCFSVSLQPAVRAGGPCVVQCQGACLARERPWTQLSGSTKQNEQINPPPPKTPEQMNKNHLEAEMAASPKYLEGVWALLWSSEYLVQCGVYSQLGLQSTDRRLSQRW